MFEATVIDATLTEEDRKASDQCNELGLKIYNAVKEVSGDVIDVSIFLTALARVMASFIIHSPGNHISHSSICCAIHDLLHSQVNDFYEDKSAPRH